QTGWNRFYMEWEIATPERYVHSPGKELGRRLHGSPCRTSSTSRNGSMANILVIDDNPAIRQLCRIILEPEGHHVAEACDGLEGVAAFRRENPNLVLCDLSMPGMDGIQVIGELLNLCPGVKVVVMGGSGSPGYHDFLDAVALLGIAVTLEKPFVGETL